MADRSAVLLEELLLAGEEAVGPQRLSEQLAADPPFLLWAICARHTRGEAAVRCVDEVARWLTSEALRVLQWPAGQDSGELPDDEAEAGQFADRVATALELAELAALLAQTMGAESVPEVRLLGLLHDAHAWLPPAVAAGLPSVVAGLPAVVAGLPTEPLPRSADPCHLLPSWLVEPAASLAAKAVSEAAEILAGRRPPPDSLPHALEHCRQVAAQGRCRWLAPVRQPGRMLPLLAAKMARLVELQQRFDAAVEREKLEALAEFAAGAGHEINNPLAVIAGRAQLFLREEQDPERRRTLAVMNAQAMRVNEMIADMRLFARPPAVQPQRIDLVELVDRLVTDLAEQARQQETRLVRTGPPGPIPIEADPVQLNVALRAVCNNALEALGRAGNVEVDVRRNAAQVEIRVTDDGPGITAEERRHLFDPFFSARQAGRGLGLGLSKCWRIVTNHGGRIDVDGRPGQGAVFTITLPLACSTNG